MGEGAHGRSRYQRPERLVPLRLPRTSGDIEVKSDPCLEGLLALTHLVAVGCDDGAADDGMLETTAAVSGTAPTDLQDLILSDGVVTTA